jgi:BirA family biotin operon repressor/biotin-[acetyl-CoA-carboxylase] ligase
MKPIIHRFESIASTNDTAIRMAEEGAPEATVVIAGEQTAGRGRRGSAWSSPLGSGLYLSMILRPDRSYEELWQLAFVGSLAVVDAIRSVSGLDPRLKWPNDVLIKGKKVCGILAEARRARRNMPHPVILGIGINVNTEQFPQEIADRATSLALELGKPLDLQDMEDALLSAIESRYAGYLSEGFDRILTAWLEHDRTIGAPVIVHTANGDIEGTAEEIGLDGGLRIRHEDGHLVCVTTGDVDILTTR